MKNMKKRALLLALLCLSSPGFAASGPGQYDSWTVRCEGEGRARQCEAFQRLTLAETGQRVIEFAVGFHPPGADRDGAGADAGVTAGMGAIAPRSAAVAMSPPDAARGVVVLPLGIMLPDGVTMTIDDRHRYAFQVRYCAADGCYAYIDLPRGVLEQMMRGARAHVAFRTLDKQDISLPVSLKGFSSALQAIR